jgi:hypothetical protein
MAGTNDREVAPVERSELDDVQAFGDGDYRRIGATKTKVCVLVGQVCRAPKVAQR